MHGFRDNDVLLPTGHDVILSPPPGGASRDFSWRYLKSDHNFSIAFHSNFLSAMHGFRDNEALLQARYDVIVNSPPGALHAIFHDGLWKSDHDFFIAFYNNFLVAVHGFRDNEVLLQTGYDVIVISPLGGVSGDFSWQFCKSDYNFLWVVNGNFCPHSNGLKVIRHSLFAWDFLLSVKYWGFLGKWPPEHKNIEKHLFKGQFLESIRVFWAIVR